MLMMMMMMITDTIATYQCFPFKCQKTPKTYKILGWLQTAKTAQSSSFLLIKADKQQNKKKYYLNNYLDHKIHKTNDILFCTENDLIANSIKMLKRH